MANRYRITNYGNTRRLPYKGQYYEIAKLSSIKTSDKDLADELGKFPLIDVKAIGQPLKPKTKAATRNRKKIKRRKK